MKIQPIQINKIPIEDINISVSEDIVRVSFIDEEGLDIKTVTIENPERLKNVTSLVERELGIIINARIKT